MILNLTNTLTRKKQAFKPENPKRVTLYVCGPTVYDHAHIGNFRPLIVFDTLFRLLRHIYGEKHVLYSSNITDIDDKIIRRSIQTGKTTTQIASQYQHDYLDHARKLNALPPQYQPKATEHISEMIAMMQTLQHKNAAYTCPSGLLFRVKSFPEYGKLSKRNPDDMLAGARIEPSNDKLDPQDFYLWKTASHNDPKTAVWDSPWGPGRPGWHIECSAMCAHTLGPHIDIHGGGTDLCFPHHENEIAQSESAFGSPMAQIWMHNGYVRFANEKMSKSLGNTLTLPELCRKHQPETIRMALLSTHYRKPLDWKTELLDNCQKRLDKLYHALNANQNTASIPDNTENNPVLQALHDDLNTPLALAELAKMIAKNTDKHTLLNSANMLGLLQEKPAAWMKRKIPASAKIQALLDERDHARNQKNWEKADRIRNQLAQQGVEIEDTPHGPKYWQQPS